MPKIDQIDRRTDVVFLLFRYADSVRGVTKLQKLLFLIEQESAFFEDYADSVGFNFAPYKMGPFSENVYTEIQFLSDMGAIDFEPMEHTLGAEPTNSLSNKEFSITSKGTKIASQLESILEPVYRYELSHLVTTYNSMDLDDLLEYVYTEYPGYTGESEIKDEVLGNA